MKQWKRLLFYLALNVFVSACTVIAVLFVWDQTSGPLPRGLLPQALTFSNTPTATRAPLLLDTPDPGPEATQQFIAYQVQSGDTFESIAEAHNMCVEELTAVNGFIGSQPLGAGEVLLIPENPTGSAIIDSVIGAGDLETEHVLLKQCGIGELSLVGWRLHDAEGNEFVFPQFPQLTLYRGGAVNVYSKKGNDTVVDLFWGLDSPVWESGETVVLVDARGNVRATYVVP